MRRPPDPVDFIRDNLRLAPVPSLPDIRLYTAHPASGLSRLLEKDGFEARPPYWAFVWAGGLVLARHLRDHPEIVAGRRVLDFGAGGGIVAIAAAMAGAREVTAAEIDPNGIAALRLNAAANGVTLSVTGDDLTAGPPPEVDLILAGDVYYERKFALRAGAFLDRCVAAGIDVLIGDPGRADLPRSRLRTVAEYDVPDFGDTGRKATKRSSVFRLVPQPA